MRLSRLGGRNLFCPGEATGIWVLLIDQSPDAESGSQRSEPNNHPQAVSVPAHTINQYEGSAQGQLGYYGNEFRDDRDFFKLELPTYGKLKLTTTVPENSNLRVNYTLFDSALRYIGEGSEYNGLAAGMYSVEMWRIDGFGAYTFAPVLEPQSAPAPFTQPVTDLSPNGKVENIPCPRKWDPSITR